MVKLIRFLFVCSVVLAILGGCFAGVTIWYFGRDLPNYKQLTSYEPPIMTRVLAGDGRILAQYATQRRLFVPIRSIPAIVSDAFISAEDKNFYTHHGVDPLSIVRAALTDIGRWHTNRRPIGASTITQQVAKNMLLTNRVTISRKIKEILLATRIDEMMPKERILELYLNQIYLGAGAYGVAAASLTYFDKPLSDLTLSEAAFLGGLPKAPNNYNPTRFPAAAKARRDWVIDRMVDDGYATKAEGAAAKAQPIDVRQDQGPEEVSGAYYAEDVRRALLARYGEKTLYESGLWVRTSLDERLQADSDIALRDGLIAYDRQQGGWRGAVTHIALGDGWPARLGAVPLPAGVATVGWRLALVLRTDGSGAAIGFADGGEGRIPFAQMRWARPLIDGTRLGAYPRRAGDVVKPGDVVMATPAGVSMATPPPPALLAPGARPANYTLCQIPDVSGALVAIDPHTGRVLAMSGGFSFELSQFDRASQAMRQPGSSIKPFVYLTALDNGFTPSTLVLDAPVALNQGPGLPKWSPNNYEANQYRGPTPLLVALTQSLNTVTARIAAMVGMTAIGQTVQRFGIMDKMPLDYSMAIGAGDTTPLRMTAAYAMLVNGGKQITPTLIDRIQDRNGMTIFRADDRPCPGCSNVEWTGQPVPVIPDTRKQIADPDSAFQIVQMMENVVQHGTGVAVKAVGRPIAGKTGTTNNFQDAWFLGFTPDLAAGVFVGYDQPVTLGNNETGGRVSAPIFRDFMIAALQNQPLTEFRIPPGLDMYRIDPRTALPVGQGQPGILMGYKPGTAPDKDRSFGLRPIPGDESPAQGTLDQASDQPDGSSGSIDQGGGGDEGMGQGQGMDQAGGRGEDDGDDDADQGSGLSPGTVVPAPPAHDMPASGTGGLY